MNRLDLKFKKTPRPVEESTFYILPGRIEQKNMAKQIYGLYFDGLSFFALRSKKQKAKRFHRVRTANGLK